MDISNQDLDPEVLEYIKSLEKDNRSLENKVDDLENKYHLIKSILKSDDLLAYIKHFNTASKNTKAWKTKHSKMLKDKIDVTRFMVKLAMKYGK